MQLYQLLIEFSVIYKQNISLIYIYLHLLSQIQIFQRSFNQFQPNRFGQIHSGIATELINPAHIAYTVQTLQ